MPRASQLEQQRRDLLPIVARAFSELGFHRATTAELAKRCEVRENILYRLWADKKAMYIAAIHFVFESTIDIWRKQATKASGRFSIADVIEYESAHLGEFGNYRILFAGLSEVDDPDIRTALARVYKDFHTFIKRQLEASRGKRLKASALETSLAAWAIIGLGTVSTIGRETGCIGPRGRRRLIKEGGKFLTDEGTVES
jgi:AcrR family transcriptional regulator